VRNRTADSDFSRGFTYMHDGRRAKHPQKRGKKSLCIDVRKPGGSEISEGHRLSNGLSRMVVENFSHGVIGRLESPSTTDRQRDQSIRTHGDVPISAMVDGPSPIVLASTI